MASTSKNPFLSPSHTGTSQQSHSPLPNINDAFHNISSSSSSSPAPSVPSSSRPNNPFLDVPQPSQAPTRPLSREEIQALEGPDGPASQPGWTGGEGPGGGGSAMSSNAYASGSTSRSRDPSPPPRERKEEGYDVPPSPTPRQQQQSSSGASGARPSNGDYFDDQAALDAAIAASLGEAPPSAPTPPPPSPPAASVFAPPPGPPPSLPARPTPPPRASSTEAPPAVDPPPAYTPMGQQPAAGEVTVDVGPSRPAFTQPEPRFQQQQQQQTGGSWIEPQHTGWSDGGGNPGGFISPQSTGFRPPSGPPPLLPPRHPSTSYRPPPMQQNNSCGGSSFQPPPQPPRPPQHPSPNSGPADTTPSSLPIPGRPYLYDSRVLVYTPGFQCPKCLNTGYKFNDPTHPCRTCWKKYGRPYTSAMALSWEQGVQGSSNWQRPLGVYQPPQIQNYGGGGGYPGYGGQSGGYYRPVQPPPGAIVYQPGDPRIGGRPCYRCGGSGQILGFFDNDVCQVCRGIGRVF